MKSVDEDKWSEYDSWHDMRQKPLPRIKDMHCYKELRDYFSIRVKA